MLNWINKKIDDYILSKCTRGSFLVTSKDEEYLQKIGNDVELIRILDTIANSIIFSSMGCRTVEGLAERNGFVKAIGTLKSMMKKKEVKPQIDFRTNLPMKKKEEQNDRVEITMDSTVL